MGGEEAGTTASGVGGAADSIEVAGGVSSSPCCLSRWWWRVKDWRKQRGLGLGWVVAPVAWWTSPVC